MTLLGRAWGECWECWLMLGNARAVLVPCHGVKSAVGYPQQCEVQTPRVESGVEANNLSCSFPSSQGSMSFAGRCEHPLCQGQHGVQVRSKSLLCRSGSSRDPQHDPALPLLRPWPWARSQAFSTRVWENSPAFWQGSDSPGTHPDSGSLCSRLLQLLPVGLWVLGGPVPAAGTLARCWPAPECPWGSDVRDNLKSLSLCALASCRRFCPWLFWEHGGAAPRHTFLASATRGFCQELPREEPRAQRREMSAGDQAEDVPILHPNVGCPHPTPSLCPSRDCIHPRLPSWAEQTQRVGDVWGDEEGAAMLCPGF